MTPRGLLWDRPVPAIVTPEVYSARGRGPQKLRIRPGNGVAPAWFSAWAEFD
jgi:hypothetical protein